MKVFIGLLAALVALNGVLALPAHSPSDDAEVIGEPRKSTGASDESSDVDFHDFKGVVDTGSGYPFLQPNPPPFSYNLGFFDAFDDIFRRLRTRLWSLDDDSTETGGFGGFDLDSSKSNSTSTVKVVDGHKIEVNETVYDNADSTFKVRIVNIRPLESGEEVDEGVQTSETGGEVLPVNPVTSAPKDDRREDADDSDERREPLERDNEIRDNVDEQKASATNNTTNSNKNSNNKELTMLPASLNEDNASANLNAAFVSDNSLEEKKNESENGNGNIEAETNKPTENEMLVEDDGTTTVAPALDEEQTNDSVAEAAEVVITSAGDGVQDASLTIENNEETEANDNFNESSEDADDAAVTAVEITKDLKDATEEQQEDNIDYTSSTLELNGEVVAPVTSAIETFGVEDFEIDEGDDNEPENSETARLSHAAFKRDREDYSSSSSDDEDVEAGAGGDGAGAEQFEMNPTFNSEWEHLAEDLERANDLNNDLNNDIDVYASVPIDLSNDIAVNDIAAAQPDFPLNPDAEFVDVEGVIKTGATMPKFEKLSLSTSYQPEGAIIMGPAK